MGKIKNIAGQRFGKLIAIHENGRNKHGHARWLCKCDCGNEVSVLGIHLRSGKTKSCGCIKYNSKYNNSEFVNKKFGRLTPIIDNYERVIPDCYILCMCDCGNTRLVYKNDLMTGRIKSCGCLLKPSTCAGYYKHSSGYIYMKHNMGKKLEHRHLFEEAHNIKLISPFKSSSRIEPLKLSQ